MNYQPFSAIGKGNIFHRVDKPDVPFLKTEGDKAVLLQGYWENDHLYARGTVLTFKSDTCVVAMLDGAVSLEVVQTDPIDPRRKFWKTGDQKVVGQGRDAMVNIFAGLYLYSGFGQGNYYSSKGNEIFGGDSTWAREQAEAEGIPFVYYDCFQWTSDPDLKHQRAQAQTYFDERTKISLKESVSAVAETA